MGRPSRRSLRIDDATIEKILNRLDLDAEAARLNRRHSPRYDYRVRSMLVEFPEGDSHTRHAVPCRNISREGISFLLGRFVYPGTPCRVRLVSEFNYAAEPAGTVVRCRYVPGTQGVHEAGIRFISPIDIEMFHHKATTLRVLVVDENPVQRAVLKRLLNKHVSETMLAETAGEAIHLALSREFDLVLLSGDGREFCPCEVVSSLRQAGYVRSVVTLTSRSLEEIQRVCGDRTCASCTPAELDQDAITHVVRELKGEPVVSSLAHDPEMADAIDSFVVEARQIVEGLEEAQHARDRSKVLALVRRLKMFAEGCGFEVIGDAACLVEEAYSGEEARHDTYSRMSRLVRLCQAARPATSELYHHR